MVRGDEGVAAKPRWRYCRCLDKWLSPEVVEWLDSGAPVNLTIGDVSFLIRGHDVIVYRDEAQSPVRH